MICPECNGSGEVEMESREPQPTPNGPHWQYWMDTCQECGGEGEIEVEPIDIDDLPPPRTEAENRE